MEAAFVTTQMSANIVPIKMLNNSFFLEQGCHKMHQANSNEVLSGSNDTTGMTNASECVLRDEMGNFDKSLVT